MNGRGGGRNFRGMDDRFGGRTRCWNYDPAKDMYDPDAMEHDGT